MNVDPESLKELTDSIRQHGIVQPIVVRTKGEDYELVAGQRRLEAVRQLKLSTIPAIIRDATDQQMLEIALIENIHREDLNCVDRAQAYKNFQDTFSLSAEDVAERLGQDRTTVTNYLRLLALPDQVIDLLRSDRLTMGHARAIAGLEKPDEQVKLSFKTVQLELSVRQVETLVSKIKTLGHSAKAHEKSPNVLDLEQQMTRALGTKVQIVTGRKKGSGKIVVEFYSLDDFDRILDRVCGEMREEL
jgi:ParB family chromosome partitioning protein